MSVEIPDKVVVHPLVLLSVADHYSRVAKDTKKRVVGVLLGEKKRTPEGLKVDITNSFAVPFEEDRKDESIWFLDHNYLENMWAMFRKVAANEKPIGWYSTGPKIRKSDIDISDLIRGYCANPVFCIINVKPPDDLAIPVEAYLSVPNRAEEQAQRPRTFAHLPCEVGSDEVEEVGVEHLMRDVRDRTVSTLSNKIGHRVSSLKGFKKRVEEMTTYLENVVNERLPPDPQIIYQLQDIFNLTPNLDVEELVKAFTQTQNDRSLVMYISSLIRSVLSLHDLLDNTLKNRELEQEKRDEKAKKKDKKSTSPSETDGEESPTEVTTDEKK